MSNDALTEIFRIIGDHELKLKSSFSLIPSENIISPVARLAFMSDAYARYFFDEHEVFGRWSFQGGSIIGDVQREILVPLLKRLGKAKHVDVRCTSGLSAMTVALAAFGKNGTPMLSIPVSSGGHPDTQFVAKKLGLEPAEIPFSDWATVDHTALSSIVAEKRPSLVYIDHATTLFPLDLGLFVDTVRQSSDKHVHIHVDTSHINGLVWGGCLENPLDAGADSYGGSTHKTFPGPHKAVLFTNSDEVADRLTTAAVNMVSHHHMSEVIALTIGMVEFDQCNGQSYARNVLRDAQVFSSSLDKAGIRVQSHSGCFTRNHQVWVAVDEGKDAYQMGSRLFDSGLIVNPYNPLPSLGGPGIRMGVNELTRLGLGQASIGSLAELFADIVLERSPPELAVAAIAELRRGCKPTYCYGRDVFQEKAAELCGHFANQRGTIEGFGDLLYR